MIRYVIICTVCVCLLLAAVTGKAQPVDDLLLTGADLHYRGQLDEAEQVFSQVLQQDADNIFALNQVALINAKQERFARAAQLFGRVAQRDAENTFARIWLGVLHLQNAEQEQARARFAEVLAIDPGSADACYFLGVMAAAEHDGATAVEWFRKAQTLGSDDPETHYRLARAFLSVEMPLNARLEFRRTLALNPRHTKALHDLGWVLHNQGYPQEGRTLWQKVLVINPQDGQARTSLAKVYGDAAFAAWQQGETDKAAGLWKKTLQYESDNKAARYYLRKLGRYGN